VTADDQLSYRRTVVVQATPEHAFEEFTQARGGWWPHDHKRGQLPVLGIGFEGGRGGEWYERAIDGSRVRRGDILVWEPPHRLVAEWPLLLGEEAKLEEIGTSQMEVRFSPHGEGTARLELEHRNMHHTTRRDLVQRFFFLPYGWDMVVDNFAAYLASEPWR
jgi:uncharacterized protein YndB with AHSA1/START domain